MGQNTAVIVKSILWDGSNHIRTIRVPFGIGRTLHQIMMKEFYSIITNRSLEDKTLKDFMKITDDKRLIYTDEDYPKGTKSPDVFDSAVIEKYTSKTNNHNGGMVIEVAEKQRNSEPVNVSLESFKVAFFIGNEECTFDFTLRDYVSERPYEHLYTGEEYLHKSFNGEFAYSEFIQLWKMFIQHYGIEEVTDKTIKEK